MMRCRQCDDEGRRVGSGHIVRIADHAAAKAKALLEQVNSELKLAAQTANKNKK